MSEIPQIKKTPSKETPPNQAWGTEVMAQFYVVYDNKPADTTIQSIIDKYDEFKFSARTARRWLQLRRELGQEGAYKQINLRGKGLRGRPLTDTSKQRQDLRDRPTSLREKGPGYFAQEASVSTRTLYRHLAKEKALNRKIVPIGRACVER